MALAGMEKLTLPKGAGAVKRSAMLMDPAVNMHPVSLLRTLEIGPSPGPWIIRLSRLRPGMAPPVNEIEPLDGIVAVSETAFAMNPGTGRLAPKFARFIVAPDLMTSK